MKNYLHTHHQSYLVKPARFELSLEFIGELEESNLKVIDTNETITATTTIGLMM